MIDKRKTGRYFILLLSFICLIPAAAQEGSKVVRTQALVIDLPHCSNFWQDPANKANFNKQQKLFYERNTKKLVQTARDLGLDPVFNHQPLTDEVLANALVLFIHLSKKPFTPTEVKTVTAYLQSGGRLFVAMDEDYWGTLDKCNINEILAPFDIRFGADWPKEVREVRVGAQARNAPFLPKPLRIPLHGARSIEGGTAFCFAGESQDREDGGVPFGVYKELNGGGRIVAMSEGMVSLYINKWKGETYRCETFMAQVMGWLASGDKPVTSSNQNSDPAPDQSTKFVNVPFASDRWSSKLKPIEVEGKTGWEIKGMALLKEVEIEDGIVEYDFIATGEKSYTTEVVFRAKSEKDYEKILRLGFYKRAQVFLNGQSLLWKELPSRDPRIAKSQGNTDGWVRLVPNEDVNLELKKGSNELIVLCEGEGYRQYDNWGLLVRLADMEGLRWGDPGVVTSSR